MKKALLVKQITCVPQGILLFMDFRENSLCIIQAYIAKNKDGISKAGLFCDRTKSIFPLQVSISKKD